MLTNLGIPSRYWNNTLPGVSCPAPSGCHFIFSGNLLLTASQSKSLQLRCFLMGAWKPAATTKGTRLQSGVGCCCNYSMVWFNTSGKFRASITMADLSLSWEPVQVPTCKTITICCASPCLHSLSMSNACIFLLVYLTLFIASQYDSGFLQEKLWYYSISTDSHAPETRTNARNLGINTWRQVHGSLWTWHCDRVPWWCLTAILSMVLHVFCRLSRKVGF